MPTIPPNAGNRVLVTGANGYIAMWVIRTLLEQGYSVRGAIRSEEKGRHAKGYFAKYGERVDWVIVPDITKKGAFDEAVKGVVAIEHTASPLPSSNADPNDTIKPAVDGTLSVLQSALKEGSNVKRIVLTSSCGAILSTVTKPTVTFDENDWADEFVQTVKEKGNDAPMMAKYRASKVLAERAAWDFYKKHKDEIGWDIVALNPPLVIGPPIQKIDSPAHLNSSLATWWKNISTESSDDVLKGSYGYIDVRDIAAAHVVSLQKESAGGERIIVSNGAITYQETRNMINAMDPKLYTSGTLPRGKPELDKAVLFIYNPEKGKKILGFKYRDLQETIRDTLDDFEARGWLKKKVVSGRDSVL